MEYFWQKDCRSECTEVNILFIGKRFYTNRDALTEKYGRIYQLPYHWAKAGVDTKLWLIDYHSTEFVTQQDDSLAIISTPVKNGSVIKQYWQESRSKKKPDIIVASGDCYIGLLGYHLAKKLNAKFVFDVYDKYDEFGGYIKLLGIDIFSYLLKKSDLRMFASKALLKQLGILEHDFILMNGIDGNLFKNLDKNEARDRLNIHTENKIVGYFGSMEHDRGVADLMQAIAILRSHSIHVELLLGGKSNPELDLNQSGIHYLGNVAFPEIPYALAACDILAIPYRRSPFMDAGASNKIAEAIACERPIVATKSPNLYANFAKQALELEKYLAEPNDPNSLSLAIIEQLEDQIIVSRPNNIYWEDLALNALKHIMELTSERR